MSVADYSDTKQPTASEPTAQIHDVLARATGGIPNTINIITSGEITTDILPASTGGVVSYTETLVDTGVPQTDKRPSCIAFAYVTDYGSFQLPYIGVENTGSAVYYGGVVTLIQCYAYNRPGYDNVWVSVQYLSWASTEVPAATVKWYLLQQDGPV